jgi:hypothetical protein
MIEQKTARWEMAWTNMVKVPGGKKEGNRKAPLFLRVLSTRSPGPSSDLGRDARNGTGARSPSARA